MVASKFMSNNVTDKMCCFYSKELRWLTWTKQIERLPVPICDVVSSRAPIFFAITKLPEQTVCHRSTGKM